MKTVVIKMAIGLGLLFAAGTTFAQDEFDLGGVKCVGGQCSCDNGFSGPAASKCCGWNTCSQQGLTCTCT